MCACDVCASCVCTAPPPVTSKERSAIPWTRHRHVTSPEVPRVFRQSVPLARCSFPRHFNGTLSALVYMYRREPASDRRRFRLKSSSPTTLILDHSRYPFPRTWLLQLPVVPQAVAMPALMFQCGNTYIILRTWHRSDAAAWAPSRGGWMRQLLLRPGRSLRRRALRITWNSA